MTLDEMQMYSLGVTTMKVLLFWLFCAFLAAGFGSRRGEGGIGFLLGLFLGPFGVLAAYFSSGKYVRCDSCRELRHPQATACPHCQREIAAPIQPPEVAAAPVRKGIDRAPLGLLVVFIVILLVILLTQR